MDDQTTQTFILIAWFVGACAYVLFLAALLGVGDVFWAWWRGKDWRAALARNLQEL